MWLRSRRSYLGGHYGYRFHESWSIIGVVEFLGRDTVREAVLVAPVTFHPYRGWGLMAGPGFEVGEEDEFLFRLGAGYEFELSGPWKLAPEVYVDLVGSGARTWVGGLAVSYEF